MTRRFDDLQPDELPEALREAVRRQTVAEREREAHLDREAYAEAAAELGISRAELDRAAAEAHAATVARIRRGRRLRHLLIGIGAAVLLAGGAYRLLDRPPPDPATWTFASPADRSRPRGGCVTSTGARIRCSSARPCWASPASTTCTCPPGTDQTAHTHPSERIGVIVRGTGECRTPGGTFALRSGMGWRIPTGCLHSFFTRGEPLDVLAWHPDSDFGPTHDHHPMVNRTLVDGVSAADIDEIRTT
jgi:mannose-6-phosphate isomerase-like protein (cupin superfamily)